MHSQLLSARSAGYIRKALIRDFLESELRAAVERLIASGELPPGDYPTPTLSDAKDASHGDFSSQFALAASKTAGLPRGRSPTGSQRSFPWVNCWIRQKSPGRAFSTCA
ncbi:MAG: hypothetical protein M5U21_04050 [Fimbriimonadaceae bacterium]|nr:hypothetical protein [Fimbriimonadaceae bacterium]